MRVAMKNEEKGKVTELKFKEWLDKNKTPYIYLDQSVNSFSLSLKEQMTQRPDFMILVSHFGFLFVDVEYKKMLGKYGKFPVDVGETIKYSRLERFSNMRIWYVFSHEDYGYKTWYWIPTSKVLESEETYESPKSGTPFFSIPVEKFIQISSTDSLKRLFSNM